MCAKLSAQLWCHSYGAITTKSPILSNINLPTNQHCKTQTHKINNSQGRRKIIEVSDAETWMLQWVWPLFPGCDWILTFQQVTKYHILEILPQNVKVLKLILKTCPSFHLHGNYKTCTVTPSLPWFSLPESAHDLLKLAIFSFSLNANFHFSLFENLHPKKLFFFVNR